MDNYPILELSGTAEELEIAVALLADHGLLGTVESKTSPEGTQEALCAYFATSTVMAPIAEDLMGRFRSLRCRIAEPLEARDWQEEWKAGLDGFPLGSGFFVLPTWKDPIETDRIVLRLDPEQAFGTGAHETTRLAVALLEEHVAPGAGVIDVGTGTGILAMVAAHRGAHSVLALEPDEAAADCARANVERNDLSERIRIESRSWEAMGIIEADVVVANIISAVLDQAVPHMWGTILLSGLLVDELDAFVDALPDDCVVKERRQEGEWAALVLERPLE